MLLRTGSRTWFVLAVMAVFAVGATALWGLVNLRLSVDAPFALAYPGVKLQVVWLVMSGPLIWICRARAREIGVKPSGVLIVWAICSTLVAAYLAILWSMGRSWDTASEFVVAMVSCIGASAFGIAGWSLSWLAFKRAGSIIRSGGVQ